MAGPLLFVFGLLSLLLAANVIWPCYRPALLTVISFFASWLCGELIAHFVLVEVVTAVVLVCKGALGSWMGVAGLVSLAVALGMQAYGLVVSYRSARVVAQALDSLGAPELPMAKDDRHWLQLLLPIPVTDRRVERTRKVAYFKR